MQKTITTTRIRNIFVSLFLLFVTSATYSQNQELPYSNQDIKKSDLLKSNVDVTVGFLPYSDFNAIKASAGINNILWKRFGAYTSVEMGKDDYFTNIIGITGSISKSIYLFGGVDFFTSNYGLINTGTLDETRKELGIGILPYKWTEIRLGWSGSIGLSIAVGVKIPLK